MISSYAHWNLVKSKKTNKQWVIKTFSEAYSQTAKNEILIMKLLDYHNIVKFKEVFIDKNNQFNIVKEHTGGGRLSQIILKKGRAVPEKHWLSEDQILNYFTQICLTIKHCHDRNIRYNDLKSGYIKVT